MVGHYNTLKNVPWEEYQFVYDNGTFTPIEFPGADQTHITGFNNQGQIIGWFDSRSEVFLFDRGEYVVADLPLPENAPRPDGLDSGISYMIDLGGLNDKGQFVGTYLQVVDWDINIFGELMPSQVGLHDFVATPQKARSADEHGAPVSR